MNNKKFVLMGIALLAIGISGCAKKPDESATKGVGTATSVDATTLKSADNRQLVLLSSDEVQIPERPADPMSLPETNPLHWYDIEYSGWHTNKLEMPKSPGDGPKGKKSALPAIR